MKALLAALVLAGVAALTVAPAAHALPGSSMPTSAAYRGFVSVGVGGGGGYYAPRPYWGVTGYRTVYQNVFVGYDAYGRAVYGPRAYSVAVYGWIYPVRAYAPRHHRPHVSVGFGLRF